MWESNYKSSIKYLNALHKRIIRIICGLPWHVSTNLSFYELHLLSLENINSYQILLLMFNFHNNLLPKSLLNTFALDIKKNSDFHSYITRSSSHYRSQYARINTILFSFICTGPILWNKLPNTLNDDDVYDNFCGAITQHMPLQGRLDKNRSHVRDLISRSSVFLVWT